MDQSQLEVDELEQNEDAYHPPEPVVNVYSRNLMWKKATNYNQKQKRIKYENTWTGN